MAAFKEKLTEDNLPLETKKAVKAAIARFTRDYGNELLSEEQSRIFQSWLRLALEACKADDEDRIKALESSLEKLMDQLNGVRED